MPTRLIFSIFRFRRRDVIKKDLSLDIELLDLPALKIVSEQTERLREFFAGFRVFDFHSQIIAKGIEL